MAIVDLNKKKVTCKIVYYGPARSGKTTNLRYIYGFFKKYAMGEMISIETPSDRTLFFDFVPIGLGKIKGFDVLLQMYTVPGDVHFKSTRKLVLRQVDGIVFVADSHKDSRQENIAILEDLKQNLNEIDLDIFKIPLILQYNKRDLGEAGISLMPIKMMEMDLNEHLKVPSFPSSASLGQGVLEVLKECLKITFRSLSIAFENEALTW
jgi:signal recognition particle receptor subunit beta